MIKTLLPTLFLFLTATVTASQPPKREVRAAWLTTIYGLDWPQTLATSPANIKRQQNELIEILDKLKAANFNTILFQTRMRGDVIYPSDIEPQSAVLTGRSAGSPGYDPLRFVIKECHKRGMECHAWIVTIPLGTVKHAASLGKRAVSHRKPEMCITYRREKYLNPAHPQTKTYLMGLVHEIVERYDVDGVHFDYLRYPENAPGFPDSRDYRKHGKGRTLAQWRRDNITEIVRHVYKGVKALKPWVKVSSSPVGKFQDTSRYPSRGWNAFHTVYQDVQGWLKEGIQDQIYPMIYFRRNDFYPFVLDWYENSNGRQVIPGLGIYFLDPKEGNWKTEEIARQVAFIHRGQLAGAGFYRTRYLMNDTQGVYTCLHNEFYTAPALPPSMPWIDDVPPTVPGEFTVRREADGYVHLTWKPATDNDPHNPPTYVIYASDSYPVDTNNPRHIIAQRVTGSGYFHTTVHPLLRKRYFAVTAMDRCNNESAPAQERRR